jgi:hypothetical protein
MFTRLATEFKMTCLDAYFSFARWMLNLTQNRLLLNF